MERGRDTAAPGTRGRHGHRGEGKARTAVGQSARLRATLPGSAHTRTLPRARTRAAGSGSAARSVPQARATGRAPTARQDHTQPGGPRHAPPKAQNSGRTGSANHQRLLKPGGTIAFANHHALPEPPCPPPHPARSLWLGGRTIPWGLPAWLWAAAGSGHNRGLRSISRHVTD